MSGQYSSAAAVLLAVMVVMMTMFITNTDCFSINQTITVSSTWCDGLNDDPSCLIGQTDLDSDEFMLDSEFSRRILVDFGKSVGEKAVQKAGESVICDRKNTKQCHDGLKNSNPKGENCAEEPTNRACHRFDKQSS